MEIKARTSISTYHDPEHLKDIQTGMKVKVALLVGRGEYKYVTGEVTSRLAVTGRTGKDDKFAFNVDTDEEEIEIRWNHDRVNDEWYADEDGIPFANGVIPDADRELVAVTILKMPPGHYTEEDSESQASA